MTVETRPAMRLHRLREEREETFERLVEIDREIDRAESEREAEHLGLLEALMYVRENATIRSELLRRGQMDEDALDEAGYLSHEDLDRLDEEGRLIEYAAEVWKLREAWSNIKFNPDMHPRDRTGKFRDILGKLLGGGTVHLPHGVKVRKHGDDAFSVEQNGRRLDAAASSQHAAERAIAHMDAAKGRAGSSQTPGQMHLPPKARAGGGTPKVLHTHPPEEQKAPGVTTHADREVAAAEQEGSVEWVGGRNPTPEEVAQDLATARRIGLNEWPPPKGEAAKRIYGESDEPRDTRHLYAASWPEGEEFPEWTAERMKLHDQIIDKLLRKRKLKVDDQGKPILDDDGEEQFELDPEGDYLMPDPEGKKIAVFMAGGTASGKTSALKRPENSDFLPRDAVHVDADEIKSLLPEYTELIGAKDRYAAFGVHEESSFLAARLRAASVERGLHMVIDGTGDSQGRNEQTGEAGKFAKKINQAVREDYEAKLFYVNAPTDLAVIRATKRAQKSGRWVPEPMVRQVHVGVSEAFPEIQEMAEAGKLSDIRGYDTGGPEAVQMFHLDEDGKFTVADPEKYDAFLEKANEAVPRMPEVGKPAGDTSGAPADARSSEVLPENEWTAPPPPVGKKGESRGGKGYSSDEAYGTNTALGHVAEQAFVQILGGGELLHPPGKGAQSPLDVHYDGLGFEVKGASTKRIAYNATPKKHEASTKEQHASELGVKPALAIVVIDSDTGQAHAYYREGLKGGRLSEKQGWKFIGSTDLGDKAQVERAHKTDSHGGA